MFELSSVLLDDIQKMIKDIQVTVSEEDEGFIVDAKLGGILPDVKKVFDTKEEAHEFLRRLEREVTLIETYVDTLKMIVLDTGLAITKALFELKNL
jgi:hypothetical protein